MNKTPINTSKRIATYLSNHRGRLELIERMWTDPMVRCYNDPDMPSQEELVNRAVFLAGPTSRHQILEYNWRCEAVSHLRNAGFKGIIYVPEPRGFEEDKDFTERGYIHEWESSRLLSADHPTFWIPRKADELLGLNTNLEFGIFIGYLLAGNDPSRLFIGWPPEAERMGLPRHYSVELGKCRHYYSLRKLCYAVVDKIPPEDVGGGADGSIPF